MKVLEGDLEAEGVREGVLDVVLEGVVDGVPDEEEPPEAVPVWELLALAAAPVGDPLAVREPLEV